MRLNICTVAGAVAMLASPAAAQSIDAAAALVGGRSVYEVKAGDTLSTIGARFGVARATLIEVNQLARPDALVAGQSLVVDNTHIAVANPAVNVTINIAQRLLVVVEGERVHAFPVAVGRRTWPTPVGAFTIVSKETDPIWNVPVSIQREMARQGKPVITRMEASPRNPIGRHWLGLSLPGLGIHGTNAPASIYAFSSHGCVRMHPDDIGNLFQRVTVGMAGVLIYEPIVVSLIDGRVWLEAHPDEYRRVADGDAVVRAAAAREALGPRINWTLVAEVLKQRRGLAVDVSAP